VVREGTRCGERRAIFATPTGDDLGVLTPEAGVALCRAHSHAKSVVPAEPHTPW
jgi:hypothetical protein